MNDRLLGMLDAAIRLGETRADEMLRLAHELQEVKGEISRAINLMKVGKADDAVRLLETLVEVK